MPRNAHSPVIQERIVLRTYNIISYIITRTRRHNITNVRQHNITYTRHAAAASSQHQESQNRSRNPTGKSKPYAETRNISGDPAK